MLWTCSAVPAPGSRLVAQVEELLHHVAMLDLVVTLAVFAGLRSAIRLEHTAQQMATAPNAPDPALLAGPERDA